jgi:hypothetical protein
MIDYLKTNWKTTVAGVSMLLTLAGKWYFERTFSIDDIVAVLGAFGLMSAKDLNVTGGSVENP